MATSPADVAVKVGTRRKSAKSRPPGGAKRWLAIAFLGPALVLLGAIVLYPTIDTLLQSFQNTDRQFIGIENFKELFSTERMTTAIKNNAIWGATAPAIITGLGLVFAILTERISYATAIKIVVFMPMAISFLATGVIWRLMYEVDPQRGFVNAAGRVVVEAVGKGEGAYPTALPSTPDEVSGGPKRGFTTRDEISPGDVAVIGFTAVAPEDLPPDAVQAAEPEVGGDQVGVVVWRDFKPGGGEPGVIESEELGLPGVEIELLDASDGVVASETSGASGAVVFSDLPSDRAPFWARVAPSTFSQGFTGVSWLGPGLVTPAIIGAFSWMWAGFAVVVIAAGLAALPRDVLEAARVDGANEWQTFRHVTLPLLAPVLGVVFVTLVINVLKIFDIVLVTAPGDVQDEANVIALEMYKTAFQAGNEGIGAAAAAVLFVLVVPIMVFNLRRFRRES